MVKLEKTRLVAFVVAMCLMGAVAAETMDLESFVKERRSYAEKSKSVVDEQINYLESEFQQLNLPHYTASPKAQAISISISSCRELNQPGATYVLANDVTATSSTCFPITADLVTLNCNGHSILAGSLGQTAVATSSSNVVVQNCRISGFRGVGIYFSHANNGAARGNSIEAYGFGATDMGAYESNHISFEDNKLSAEFVPAFATHGNDITIKRNTLSGGWHVISFFPDNNGVITQNEIYASNMANGYGAIFAGGYGGEGLKISDNHIVADRMDGIDLECYMFPANNVQVHGNTIEMKKDYGTALYADSCPGSFFKGNKVGSSGENTFGIFSFDSPNIVLDGNTGIGEASGIVYGHLFEYSPAVIRDNNGYSSIGDGMCMLGLSGVDVHDNIAKGGAHGMAISYTCGNFRFEASRTADSHFTNNIGQCTACAGSDAAGILASDISDSELSGNTAEAIGSSGYGLLVRNAQNTMVSSNTVQSTQGVSLKLEGSNSNNQIEGNHISNDGTTAAADLGSSSGNTFNGNTVDGSVAASSMQNGIFSGNTVEGALSGLTFDSVSNTQLTLNTVVSTDGTAMVLRNGQANTIDGNTVSSQAVDGRGISLEGISTSTLQGNSIDVIGAVGQGYGLAFDSFGSQGSTGNTVKENSINSQHGLSVLSFNSLSGNNDVFHNTIKAGPELHTWIDNAASNNRFQAAVGAYVQGNNYFTGGVPSWTIYPNCDSDGDGFADAGLHLFNSQTTSEWHQQGFDAHPATANTCAN